MSEDPAVYEVTRRKVPHLKVVLDYLKGLKYREIEEKYGITRGGIQYALEKMGVRPNRIKSASRLSKTKEHKTKGAYLQNAGFIPVKEEIKKDNNPVLVDDLDIMEREDLDQGNGDDPSYEIGIDEEGEIEYD